MSSGLVSGRTLMPTPDLEARSRQATKVYLV